MFFTFASHFIRHALEAYAHVPKLAKIGKGGEGVRSGFPLAIQFLLYSKTQPPALSYANFATFSNNLRP